MLLVENVNCTDIILYLFCYFEEIWCAAAASQRVALGLSDCERGKE